MTYIYRLLDFAHGLALPFALALVHLRCIHTAGQQTRIMPERRLLGLFIAVAGIATVAALLGLVATELWRLFG